MGKKRARRRAEEEEEEEEAMAAAAAELGGEESDEEEYAATALADEEEEDDDADDADDDDDDLEHDVGVRERDERTGKLKDVYDVEGLHDKLEEFGWGAEAAWPDTLAIVSDVPTTAAPHDDDDADADGGAAGKKRKRTRSATASLRPLDVHDDLKRELHFFNQALDAAKAAAAQAAQHRLPFRRPLDYYAEMVKTDGHMLKIKQRLVSSKNAAEAAAASRKQRELKRYSKQVQAEKEREKAQQRKREEGEIKRWRKRRANESYSGDGAELPESLQHLDGDPKRRSTNASQKKREYRNQKFGFGGRKALQKQNTAESAADMSGYKGSYRESKTRGRGGAGRGRGGGRGGVQKKRLGKSRRQRGR